MNNKKIIKNALINSIIAVAYIAIVATFMANAEKGLLGKEDTVLTGMAFLLLFVFSAAVMAITVFGKSVLWYLDGLKKEAIKLVFYTIGFLFAILVIVLLVLIF